MHLRIWPSASFCLGITSYNDIQHPSFLLSHWQLEVPTTLLMTEQNQVIEESSGLHTYPPSSSILPISRSDIGISSAGGSTKEHPTLNGTQQRGLWDVSNEIQRGMHSRHLIMIGMSSKIPHSLVLACKRYGLKTLFTQLLVVPWVPEYSWVLESCVDRVHFHIVVWSWHLSPSRP